MSTISLRISKSLHKSVRETARKEGISINQLITTALAEKLSALMTEDFILDRARRGKKKKFDRAMIKVRDKQPDSLDKI